MLDLGLCLLQLIADGQLIQALNMLCNIPEVGVPVTLKPLSSENNIELSFTLRLIAHCFQLAVLLRQLVESSAISPVRHCKLRIIVKEKCYTMDRTGQQLDALNLCRIIELIDVASDIKTVPAFQMESIRQYIFLCLIVINICEI